MSISWKPTSVIHTPISAEVLNQIRVRSNILNKKNNRTDSDLIYLNASTGWIKVSSGVDIEGEGSDFAKSNVLFGGTLDIDKGKRGGILTDYSSYEFSEQYGYRPMAGITNFTVENLDTFGAVKQGSIEFKVNDLQSLNKLESLYLRPGYSILIEYGHTVYQEPETVVTEKEENGIKTRNVETKFDRHYLSSSPSYIANFFKNIEESDKEHRMLLLVKKIEELRKTSGYNYDGFFGRISNFSWAFNPDTTYDCRVDVLGYGSVIESLSALSSTTLLSTEDGVEVKDKNTSIGNDFTNVLDAGIEVQPNKLKTKETGDSFVPYAVTHFASPGDIEEKTSYGDNEDIKVSTVDLDQLRELKVGSVFELRDNNDSRAITRGGANRNYVVVEVYNDDGSVNRKGYMKTAIFRFDSRTDITDRSLQNQPDQSLGLVNFKEGRIINDEASVDFLYRINISEDSQKYINKNFRKSSSN